MYVLTVDQRAQEEPRWSRTQMQIFELMPLETPVPPVPNIPEDMSVIWSYF